MRGAWAAAALGLAAGVYAQAPDVVVHVDLLPNYRSTIGGNNAFRFYDALGRASTVGLSMILEPGFRVVVKQRVQTIRGDGDSEQLEEYYVEDAGLWRLGKQYLPFGRGGLVRESVTAARGDTNLVIEGLPVSIATCDGGMGRPRGVIGRIGSRIGLSFAVGKDFGISSTSFATIRRPEETPGVGNGYGKMFGIDASRRVGSVMLGVEWMVMREGSSSLAPDREVGDLTATFAPNRDRMYLFGWSVDSRESEPLFRVEAKVPVARGMWFEPLVKFAGTRITDFGVAMRFKF